MRQLPRQNANDLRATTGAMTPRKQIFILALLGGLLAGGWYWWSGGFALPGTVQTEARKVAKPAPATAVLVEPIQFARNDVVIRAIGTGDAVRSASIFPSVAGEVTAVNFTAGQQVSQGDVLLRLDDKHQRLAVRLAEVAVKEARRQVKRLAQLAPSGVASVARLETAQTELESAKLRLAQAREDLADRAVLAPFDGVIGLSDIERGDRVSDTTRIATLDDRSKILVEFDLPEEYALRIKLGGPVTLRPWTSTVETFPGVIHAIDSRIDQDSRTLRVKARIDNPDGRLRPGTSFRVELAFKGATYPSVREVAVLWSRDGAYVWRVDEDRAEKVYARIVRRDKGRTLVDGPLKAGDEIVVEGVQGLRQGQPVKPAPFSEKGEPE